MAVTSFPPPSTPTPPVATFAPAPAMASVPAPTVTMLTAPTLPASNIPEQYKNLLHNYIQKASLPMAVYRSFNEGSVQWPRFRATVLVGEEQFSSSNVFLRRKEAEHDAAKTALECLQSRIKVEEIPIPIILEGTIFCKSILNEYAAKRQMEMPAYKTIQPQRLLPVFVSSVVFNGVTYTGENARTKKDAEQLAARAQILALINCGDSTSRAIMFEIIKSKSRFYKDRNFQNTESSTAPVGNDNAPIIAITQAAPEFHPAQQAVSQAAPEVHPPQQAISQAAPEVHPPEQAVSRDATKVHSSQQAVSQAAPEVHPPQQAVSQAAPEVYPSEQSVSRDALKVHPPQQAVSQEAAEVHPPQQAVSQAALEVHPPEQAVSRDAPKVHPPQQAFAAVPTRAAVEKVIKPVAEAVQGLKPPITTVEQAPDIPHHVFAVPKVAATKEGIQLPIAFVPPMVDPSPDVGPSSGKRKRRNKRKSQKKMCLES